MLISIGRRSEPEDLVGLLLECHQRIRTFMRLAEDVGGRADLPEDQVVDACLRFERYFTEALPRHVEDEEQSLLPRLRGQRPELDAALSAMHAQHREHEPLLEAMLTASRCVRSAPRDATSREQLRSAASALSAELERHLGLEEQVLFPAVRSVLSSEAQAEVIAELRDRRKAPTT